MDIYRSLFLSRSLNYLEDLGQKKKKEGKILEYLDEKIKDP